METGWKVDLVVRKERAFSEAEFSRRVRWELLGVPLWVCSPEGSILSKLEWARQSGGSERQLRDVAGIWEQRRGSLDTDYIERWAEALGGGWTRGGSWWAGSARASDSLCAQSPTGSALRPTGCAQSSAQSSAQRRDNASCSPLAEAE